MHISRDIAEEIRADNKKRSEIYSNRRNEHTRIVIKNVIVDILKLCKESDYKDNINDEDLERIRTKLYFIEFKDVCMKDVEKIVIKSPWVNEGGIIVDYPCDVKNDA